MEWHTSWELYHTIIAIIQLLTSHLTCDGTCSQMTSLSTTCKICNQTIKTWINSNLRGTDTPLWRAKFQLPIHLWFWRRFFLFELYAINYLPWKHFDQKTWPIWTTFHSPASSGFRCNLLEITGDCQMSYDPLYTVQPHYNTPRYNANSLIRRWRLAPKILSSFLHYLTHRTSEIRSRYSFASFWFHFRLTF